MLRTYLCSVIALLFFAVCVVQADDTKKDDKNPTKARITKVDPKAKTITVKMKDRDGKEVEKTFTLAEDIRYLDSTGKAVAIDVFQSGDDVLILEKEGKVQELRKDKKKEERKDK